MSGTSKRSNDDKAKGSMDNTTSSGNNPNMVSNPSSLLQEMSRSNFVPGYPAPGSFPGFHGRAWQDLPPFLLRGFMPPVPLGMDMLSTALLHSLQGSSIYPSPTNLPMMRSQMGLMQPPFNAPIFTNNDSLRSSPLSKSHKQDSKQRISKRTPSETNIYAQTMEQLVTQKNKDVQDNSKRYSPIRYNSPRTKSNKSVEESIIIPGDDEPLDVIKIPDDNNSPLALVTKKMPQSEFEESLPQTSNLSCQNEPTQINLQPLQSLPRDLDRESCASRKSSTPIQAEERPSSKPGGVRPDCDQPPSEQDFPEQRNATEDPAATNSKHSIALPPRKRLTRNTEDMAEAPISSTASLPFLSQPAVALQSTVLPCNTQPSTSSTMSMSFSDSPQSSNFRSCWKKFSAKITNHCQPVHRSYHAAGKPMYDCRAIFQKLSNKDAYKPGVLLGKPYLSGRFHHRARYTPRKEPQVQEGSSSPRITRSQARQKKVNAEESGTNAPTEPQEVAPIRKSLRKKTSNSKYDAPDIVTPGTKTRKPRNSKNKNQEESKMSSDSLNDSSTLNGAEKSSDDVLDPNKSKKDEPSTGQDPSNGSDRTPDKVVADDLPQSTPAIPTSLEDSKTEKRLDSCDRKSTSSGLSTCSGDVSFDPEFPISLPPKFRHTKRKPAFLNFSVDDKSSETSAAAPTLATSIHHEVQAPVSSTTSTPCPAPTVTTSPVTLCDTLVSGVTTTANNVVSVSEPATRLEIAQPAKVETTMLTTTAPVEPLETDDDDATDEKPVAPTSPVMIQREIPTKADISASPRDDRNVQHVTKVVEPDKISTASHASLADQKPSGQTKITLKFDSDTISTLISTSQLSEAVPSVHINNFSTGKSESSSKRSNHVKPHENVSEFRLKIDLAELSKKSDEQMKRPVMVLMPEDLKTQDVAKHHHHHHHHHHDVHMDVNDQQVETAKSESCPSTAFKSSEGFSCTRKVEVPGSSKIKTISVLLRSRADLETIKSSMTNIDVPPSEHTSHPVLQEEPVATDTTAQEESLIDQDQSLCKTSKADKKKKKGKGMKKKRQKRKQSTDGQSCVGIDDNSISPRAPIIVRAKESSSSLNGNQSSNSPPQLEMAAQLTYADHFSDISDSEVGRMRLNVGKQMEAAIKIVNQDGVQPVPSSSECNADQKGGLFISRKRKRSPTSNSAQVSVSTPVINPNVSAESNASSVESTVTASFSTSSVSNANFGGHSSRRHEGKSVDIYDWNANNDCDNNDLDDIMRIRQNRLANRLMSTNHAGQSSSSSTPLKKRFLPTDNQPTSFDNLLSSCKSVSVVVQKLEKDGQETCENNTPAPVPDSNISPAKANGSKRKRKKGKQENKKVKRTVTPLENISTPINVSYTKPLTQVANSLSCCGPTIPISSPPNISPVSSSSVSRETRIPPSIRLPHLVISSTVNPQPQMTLTEVKPSFQNGKVVKSIKSDRQMSEPVKFKLKKIGRQWISVNDKDKLEDSTPGTPRKDKDKKKAEKDLPTKKSPKVVSIFMPDSLTHGFVCNDRHLQQAFTEKILISEFFKKTFDVPPHSAVLDVSPNNVSFKFVFDDKTDECEVSMLVNPNDVFFVPGELELLMSALSIDDDEKIPEIREPSTTESRLVRPCQVTSLGDVHLLLRPEVEKPVVIEGGKTILVTGGRNHSTSEYKKKDELLCVPHVDEDAQNFDDFKMQAKTARHPLLYVPLFDDASTLENADDPWDIFGCPMINVIM